MYGHPVIAGGSGDENDRATGSVNCARAHRVSKSEHKKTRE